MKKKMIFCITLLFFVGFCVFAAGGQSAPAPAAGGSNANRTLVFIPKATNSQFWVAIWDGAKKAAEELGYREVRFQGTTSAADITGQVDVLSNVTTSRPAGIIIAVNDSVALRAPIENSINAGVPVVTVNAGVESNRVPVHVATDNYNAGAMGADTLAKLIGERGTVIFIGIDATSENGRQRESGFRDRIA